VFFFQHGKPFGKQHWSAKGKGHSRASWSADDDDVKFSDTRKEEASDSSLWVDSYKPTNIRQIIGQQGDKSGARKLYTWLSNWHDNFWKKPIRMFDTCLLPPDQFHFGSTLSC